MRFLNAVALATVMLWLPVDGVAQRNEYGSGPSYLVSGTVEDLKTPFCDGFYAGYSTGYKQAKGNGLEPLRPLCPLQPLKGLGDPKSDFEHGYTIGYSRGTAAGRR